MDQEPEGIIGLPRTISSSVSADHGEATRRRRNHRRWRSRCRRFSSGDSLTSPLADLLYCRFFFPSLLQCFSCKNDDSFSQKNPSPFLCSSFFSPFLFFPDSLPFHPISLFFFFFFSFHPLLPPKGGIGRFFYQQSSGQLPMEEKKMEDPPPEIPLPIFLPFSFCFPLFSSPCFPLFFTFLFSGSTFFLKRFSLLK